MDKLAVIIPVYYLKGMAILSPYPTDVVCHNVLIGNQRDTP